jgi:two-component system OmpR family response regulator
LDEDPRAVLLPCHHSAVRVLLVEDSVRLARLTEQALEALGFRVAVEIDGTAGYHRARAGGFDVVVLDLMLPGMNGYRICSALRAAEVWTPVLVLTAKDGEWDEAEALDTGADDYLRKPFSIHVLAARLRALARRGGPPRPSALTAGTLTLDPRTRTVTRRGAVIDLTPREFDLLEALARAGGDPVSKPDLLRRVWGRDPADAGADANLVEVYIRYLRRKVDEPFGTRSVATVRGLGYRLLSSP